MIVFFKEGTIQEVERIIPDGGDMIKLELKDGKGHSFHPLAEIERVVDPPDMEKICRKMAPRLQQIANEHDVALHLEFGGKDGGPPCFWVKHEDDPSFDD